MPSSDRALRALPRLLTPLGSIYQARAARAAGAAAAAARAGSVIEQAIAQLDAELDAANEQRAAVWHAAAGALSRTALLDLKRAEAAAGLRIIQAMFARERQVAALAEAATQRSAALTALAAARHGASKLEQVGARAARATRRWRHARDETDTEERHHADRRQS